MYCAMYLSGQPQYYNIALPLFSHSSSIRNTTQPTNQTNTTTSLHKVTCERCVGYAVLVTKTKNEKTINTKSKTPDHIYTLYYTCTHHPQKHAQQIHTNTQTIRTPYACCYEFVPRATNTQVAHFKLQTGRRRREQKTPKRPPPKRLTNCTPKKKRQTNRQIHMLCDICAIYELALFFCIFVTISAAVVTHAKFEVCVRVFRVLYVCVFVCLCAYVLRETCVRPQLHAYQTRLLLMSTCTHACSLFKCPLPVHERGSLMTQAHAQIVCM